MTVLVYVVLCVLPAAAFTLAARGFDAFTTYAGRRPRASRDEPAECEKYRRTLRRLAADHDRLLTADLPARAARLRAVELAYDDTLRHACVTLDLDPPPAPLTAVERVQVEAELVLHGLDW
jgi:hypothetical protein